MKVLLCQEDTRWFFNVVIQYSQIIYFSRTMAEFWALNEMYLSTNKEKCRKAFYNHLILRLWCADREGTVVLDRWGFGIFLGSFNFNFLPVFCTFIFIIFPVWFQDSVYCLSDFASLMTLNTWRQTPELVASKPEDYGNVAGSQKPSENSVAEVKFRTTSISCVQRGASSE